MAKRKQKTEPEVEVPKQEVVPEPEVEVPEVEVPKQEVVPEPEVEVEVPEVEVPKQEVVPEPEVEVPEVEVEVPEAVTTMDTAPSGVLDISGVSDIIVSPDYSMSEKINMIHTKAEPMFSTLAGKLLGYQESMGVGRIDASSGSGKQYDLLHTLTSVLGTEDYSLFKTKFDIVNMAYRAFKDSAFKDVMLFRFSELWAWNDKDLVTLQHLNTIIGVLCDLSSRKENISKIDMMKALDSDEVNLTETAVSNIQKYYKV